MRDVEKDEGGDGTSEAAWAIHHASSADLDPDRPLAAGACSPVTADPETHLRADARGRRRTVLRDTHGHVATDAESHIVVLSDADAETHSFANAGD